CAKTFDCQVKKMFKTFVIFFILFLAAVLAAGGFFAMHMADYARSPANKEITRTVEIVVKPGDNFRAVADKLLEKEIIRHPLKFRILADYQKSTTKIKAGEYRISGAMSPKEILGQLAEGRVLLHRLTVAEGLNIYQVAQKAEHAALCEKNEFINAATNPDLADEMGIAADTVEGYLYPETYFFQRPISAENIIRTMVKRFWDVFLEQWEERAKELGFSVHEIVTLASIIEKETGIGGERKLVSSVFHNRLEKGMRLDSDPTVIYGIENFDGNITRKNLRTSTPYNTYTFRGMPPGPIANPGRAALEAALYPADTDYLYFVAKPDKSHHFSTSLSEHNQAVRKYQLNK
ncbi:MAG: endolytic transglycosylase MltG, partial [Desulfosalsimonas sp.]